MSLSLVAGEGKPRGRGRSAARGRASALPPPHSQDLSCQQGYLGGVTKLTTHVEHTSTGERHLCSKFMMCVVNLDAEERLLSRLDTLESSPVIKVLLPQSGPF